MLACITHTDNPLSINLSETDGGNQDCCNNCESLGMSFREFLRQSDVFQGFRLTQTPFSSMISSRFSLEFCKNQEI